MKKYPILCCLMLIMSAISCTGEFDYSLEDVDILDVEARVISFDHDATSRKLQISSDEEWTVSETVDVDWLTVEKLSDGISVNVTANPTILERESTLQIAGGSRKAVVKVKQAGVIPSFSASRDLIGVVYGGGVEQIDIQANVEWEAKTHCDWMALTRTESGLSVTLPENKTDKRRNAHVDFYNAGVRFARILISQASSVPQPADYYSVDISAVDWAASYVHYMYDTDGNVVAVVTKESVDGISTVVRIYPAPSGVADFNAGKDVTASMMYVNSESTRIYSEDPHVGFEEVVATIQEPLVVVSDVKSHGAVKVGQQIWLAEDYKTTTFADGTSIPCYSNGGTIESLTSAAVTVYEGHYMYTAYTAGFNGSKFVDNNFAPEGWAVPTKDQYLILIQSTGKDLDAMISGPYLFGATLNYKAVPNSSRVIKVSSLGYTNTWSCTPSSNKVLMMGMKSDGSSLNSAQTAQSGFAIRLIKE